MPIQTTELPLPVIFDEEAGIFAAVFDAGGQVVERPLRISRSPIEPFGLIDGDRLFLIVVDYENDWVTEQIWTEP